MRRRAQRQEAIREVVRSSQVRTQNELVQVLRARGFECTQATVSRDVTDMGLSKVSGGAYVLAEDLHLRRMIEDLVVDIVRSDNLVLVKASTGTGPGVGAALDAAGLDGVLGSIAGDDTVLLIAESATAADGLVGVLGKFRRQR